MLPHHLSSLESGLLTIANASGTSKLARELLQTANPIVRLAAWEKEVPPSTLASILHAVRIELKQGFAHPMLREMPLDLTLGDRTIHLDLLLLPSIFTPEEWGITFLEGLLRKPLREYAGKRLIELGTGSGWVSLALLRFSELEKVLAVDLNPQAVLIARLNAILNSFDVHGNPLPDRLHERFQTAESDLLEAARNLVFQADFIVGCIPQVITVATDLESTQGLYDLSNYFVAQGLVEDQFGLGLNARAIQESLLLLKPGGSIILNLAGRPGKNVVERMFRRRGLQPHVLWRARVQQAADTDIQPIVELERRTQQPFAFHLHRHSPQSIPARVALAALKAGQPIFHELQVIEGVPQSESLLALARALRTLDLESLWENLDLSNVSDEQLQFVTRLAEQFIQNPRAPYAHEAGDHSFRKKVTDFLRKFHGLALDPAAAFVAPSRQELLHILLLTMLEVGDCVVLSEDLRGIYGAAITKAEVDAIWVHDDLEEIAELLPILQPKMVLAAPRDASRNIFAAESLRRLLKQCEVHNALLVLDESNHFVIGAKGPENPSLSFMAQHPDSAHLAILIDLIHSQAFPDVGLTLFFARHPQLLHGLALAAEVTYSRISYFHQAYYDSLFDELLSFRLNAQQVEAETTRASTLRKMPQLSRRIQNIAKNPAFVRPEPAADVIRLDYGENTLLLPKRLQAGILRGFLAEPTSCLSLPPPTSRIFNALSAATDYLQATRLPKVQTPQVLLGMGTLPLLFDALRAAQTLVSTAVPLRVLLPQGSYGLFAPLIQASGAEVISLAVEPPDFLVSTEALAKAPTFDVLLLTNPGNPSGVAYSATELQEIIRYCASKQHYVVLDEVFGLLAHLEQATIPMGQDRWQGLNPPEQQHLLLLCGVSKEFAAGGLRLGLAASANALWMERLQDQQLNVLPQHIQVAAETLFADFAQQTGELAAMRRSLYQRRELLQNGLAALGFKFVPGSCGGLFLYPDVSGLTDNPEALILELENKAKVRLNTPSWSGVDCYARACFSISESEIHESLRRLQQYFKESKEI